MAERNCRGPEQRGNTWRSISMKDDLSGSQTTGYRGARVEVIEAGNQLIQYRIRNHMKGM